MVKAGLPVKMELAGLLELLVKALILFIEQ